MQFAETVLQGYPDTEPERLVVELAMAKQQKWDMLSVSAVADKLRHVEPAVRTQQHVWPTWTAHSIAQFRWSVDGDNN